MPTTITIDAAQLNQWNTRKLDPEMVREELNASGMDAEAIEAHLVAYKKLRNENKQFRGFLLCGAGAFLGFIGCVLSMVNPIPELYGFFLYGLTSLAIFAICGGLYYLFE
jgi:hypothetical protein